MKERRWKIIYYETSHGECPVKEFIDSRHKRNQAKVLSLISLLKDRGPNLPRPYADLLLDGIHELRVKLSGDRIRVLYFFCYRDFIVLTHVFIKKTKKVPKSEIGKAKKCRKDLLSRYTKEELYEIVRSTSQG